MQKTDKERIVAELAEQLGSTDTLIVADYRGLTNKQLEALRDELLTHGARFRIVKNTLTRRAAELSGAESLLVMLEGPTAIAFIESGGDPAAVAKALSTTARETNVLTLRGGVLEGKTLSGEEIEALGKLPPADVLRGQLLGAIVAPLTQLVGLLSAPLRDLHGLVDARIRQLEEAGEVAVSAAAPDEADGSPAVGESEADEAPPATEVVGADEPMTAEAESEESPAAEAARPADEADAEAVEQDVEEEPDSGESAPAESSGEAEEES